MGDKKLMLIYGLTCAAIIFLYYDHTKKIEKTVSDIQAEFQEKMKAYEDAVATKASEQ